MASLLRFMLTRPVFKPACAARVVVRSRNFTAGNYFLSKKYTKDHEWVLLSDSDKTIATVGITQYAQKALGEVVFVDLPQENSEVEAGETVGAVESVKSASDILSPVSGLVVKANTELASNPKLINESAEDNGWICKIEVKDSKEIEALMDKKGYDAYVEGADH
ncbi:glycine cleavage system H protein [Tuber borchii]|uniref:Glycine cleavage system H protein n=1 Tax=Tuber borchii TaxID=42251 RepID=A0A2T6ZDQ7_TUBBO|nr:glycine cleavage system H protein [Tuber borchii]